MNRPLTPRCAASVLLGLNLFMGQGGCAPPREAIVYEIGGGTISSTAWALGDASEYLESEKLNWGAARVILRRGGEYWIFYEQPAPADAADRKILIWTGPKRISRL